MRYNVGSIDRVFRVLAALVVGILYITGQITGTAAIILGIVAIVLVLTSAISLCPLYMMLGLSTIKKKDA